MLYLDSSLVVSLLVPEPHSKRADAWLSGRRVEPLLVSDWVTVEVAAALAAKLRLGVLDKALLEQAFDAYRSLIATTFQLVRPSTAHYTAASRMALKPEAKLSGADALHLAIADSRRAPLCTLDKRQADAGRVIGVETELV